MEKMTALFRDPKLPEQFRNLPSRDVCDFNWLTFAPWRLSRHQFSDDKEAAGGIAAAVDVATSERPSDSVKVVDPAFGQTVVEEITAPPPAGNQPLTFGVTGGMTVTLKPGEIPQDEKYHLYKIGRITVNPGTTVWVLKGQLAEGQRLGVNVDRLLVTNAADSAVNEWNAYISLKVKGPAYVKGSTNANMAWMDRVLLVKPQPGEKPDAAELQRLKEQKELDARLPQVRVPRALQGAGGDPLKVDWDKAVKGGAWSTLKGADTARKVEARFAQDGDHLYIRLTEEANTGALVSDPGIFGGDDWELLFAGKRGAQPYRQIGINPKGKHQELAYGESSRQWDSGVTVISEVGSNLWSVRMGFPLPRLLPGGAKPGQSVYANIMRGGKDPLAWSPTYEDGFNLMVECLGEIVLE